MTSKKYLTVFSLTMINLATVLSIRNWPVTAEYGFSSISFLLLAMLFFFIPCALVSAELASSIPKAGGVFAWVKEALGHRLGFLAIWLQWVENVVWYPAIISFIAASFAYMIAPSLSQNPWYQFFMITGIFWLVTCVNLAGMKVSSWISTFAVIFGTLIPGVLIISLALTWVSNGHHFEITFSWQNVFPKFDHIADWAFLAGIFLSFCGIEMSAVHATDVINPQKNYSRAIAISATLIMILSILGTLAIAIILPKTEISLVSGSIEALYKFLSQWNLSWLIPILAASIGLGALGGVSTWAAGPCRGLLAAAQNGDFPPFMHKSNKHNMPVVVMIIQASIVTLLAILFVFMPNVNSSFWLLSVLAAEVYLIMYILMFLSAIVLRYKKPTLHRPYKIPGGNLGMWVVSGLGLMGSLFAMVLGFFPPSQIQTGSFLFYELFLSIGIIVCTSIPFIIFQFRKETWLLPHEHNK
jgi:putative glutamate/gamma-aminobutyrate antiporter